MLLLATETPAPTGSSSVDLTVALVVAGLAAIPGIGGLILAFRKRRDLQEATATELGSHLAQQAFENMQSQIHRLSGQLRELDDARDEWERDKAELLRRINELTAELARTNLYLQSLLYELDTHGIAHPSPPPGFTPHRP